MRGGLGLTDPVVFQSFLRDNGIMLEQWNDFAGGEIVKNLLKEQVVSDSMVEQHFLRNSREFESVIVAKIIVHDEGKIKQILNDLAMNVDFAVCAQRYSTDPLSRFPGGIWGRCAAGCFPRKWKKKFFLLVLVKSSDQCVTKPRRSSIRCTNGAGLNCQKRSDVA